MYKGFVKHNNDLKFNPTEHKQKPEKEKDKQETKSKKYERNRQTDKAHIISQV